jgi:hypothetical protein
LNLREVERQHVDRAAESETQPEGDERRGTQTAVALEPKIEKRPPREALLPIRRAAVFCLQERDHPYFAVAAAHVSTTFLIAELDLRHGFVAPILRMVSPRGQFDHRRSLVGEVAEGYGWHEPEPTQDRHRVCRKLLLDLGDGLSKEPLMSGHLVKIRLPIPPILLRWNFGNDGMKALLLKATHRRGHHE